MPCSNKFFVGETGSTLVVNAGINLVSATELLLTLKKPNCSYVELRSSAGELTVGSQAYTNTLTNEVYASNEYVIYNIGQTGSPSESVFDMDGLWTGQLTYFDDSESPPTASPGCTFTFEVLKSL